MTIVSTPPSTPAQGALVPVAVNTLLPSSEVEFDLYVRYGEHGELKLYRRRTYPLTRKDIERLAERGITTLYVSASDSAAYHDYLLDHVVQNDSVSPIERYRVLRETTKAVLSESLESKSLDKMVGATSGIAERLVGTVCHSSVLLDDLFHVIAHDYSTFTHMMNVSTYAVLLANNLGITNQQELIAIAQGALLHDIGKLDISTGILTKPARLTQQETKVMRTHPAIGFRKLAFRDDLDWGQLMMVYQHHEKCNGQGYPTNSPRDEIHDWARLCAVVDVFEALTHERHYRRASLLGDVLTYLDARAGSDFDREMVHCLKTTWTKPT